VLATILGCQLIGMRARRAAHDVMFVAAGIGGGVLPGPVVGHRPFDGEHAPVEVSDDEVEWLDGLGCGHEPVLFLIKSVIKNKFVAKVN